MRQDPIADFLKALWIPGFLNRNVLVHRTSLALLEKMIQSFHDDHLVVCITASF